jgi:uncharacterized protein YxjI
MSVVPKSVDRPQIDDRFLATDTVAVKQQVERWEAYTGFETPNQYSVIDCFGNVVFLVEEEAGELAQTLSRLFLKAARPFTLHVLTPDGNPVIRLERPFRFYFHEVRITDAVGRTLGTVTRRFSLVHRIYSVSTRSGASYELYGPLWRPWTFKILQGGTECGVITKQWSGALKEMFTDADTFGVTFPRGCDLTVKAVLLGAVFLIDFAHFEENHRN